jgi:hypothetical protein
VLSVVPVDWRPRGSFETASAIQGVGGVQQKRHPGCALSATNGERVQGRWH